MLIDSLYRAYEPIRSLYVKQNLSPGTLTHIGCTSGWVTVDATNGQSGMAFNFSGEHAVHGIPEPRMLLSLQPFVGKDLFALSEHLLRQDHIMLRAACLAALNALSCPLTERNAMIERGVPLGTEEDYSFIRPGDTVTVVGYGRVIGHLQSRCIPYHVLDMRPLDSLGYWSIGQEVKRGPEDVTFHATEETEQVLSQSDVLFMTGCTLVNGTLDSLLPHAKNARVVSLFGPSAGILPEYLLSLGINYILSNRCVDERGIFSELSQVTGRHSLSDTVENYIVQAF